MFFSFCLAALSTSSVLWIQLCICYSSQKPYCELLNQDAQYIRERSRKSDFPTDHISAFHDGIVLTSHIDLSLISSLSSTNIISHHTWQWERLNTVLYLIYPEKLPNMDGTQHILASTLSDTNLCPSFLVLISKNASFITYNGNVGKTDYSRSCQKNWEFLMWNREKTYLRWIILFWHIFTILTKLKYNNKYMNHWL